jgi:hypothetical protein
VLAGWEQAYYKKKPDLDDFQLEDVGFDKKRGTLLGRLLGNTADGIEDFGARLEAVEILEREDHHDTVRVPVHREASKVLHKMVAARHVHPATQAADTGGERRTGHPRSFRTQKTIE